MGGLWVDYELMTTVEGLYALGEANFSDHGANRLGASALMQGLADGYFCNSLYYWEIIWQMKSERNRCRPTTKHLWRQKIEVNARIQQLMNIKGTKSVESFHKRLGKIMWDKCGMARNAEGLQEAITEIQALKKRILERC